MLVVRLVSTFMRLRVSNSDPFTSHWTLAVDSVCKQMKVALPPVVDMYTDGCKSIYRQGQET